MVNQSPIYSACEAILEETEKILRTNPPDPVMEEVWRIKKLINTDCDSESLNKIHDEALDLHGFGISEYVHKRLDLIMSIARYEIDTRSPRDR